jgi:polysaccharide biosynthesis PFTS motif protein
VVSLKQIRGSFARRRLRRIRSIMRGYRRLRSAGRLHLLPNLKDALTTTPIAGVQAHASELVFGAARDRAEMVVRQYALTRFADVDFNGALLASLAEPGGRVSYALPGDWQGILREHGFNVAGASSTAKWNGAMVLRLGAGVVRILELALGSLAVMLRRRPPPPAFAHFDALGSGNLPQPGPDGRSHDILSWYAQWPGRSPEVRALTHGLSTSAPAAHGIPVFGEHQSVPLLDSAAAIARFVMWALGATTISAIALLRGRWWHALILREAAVARAARLQRREWLARDYLFHNSGWIYRPLWTYEAEARGSRILFYAYSTNCEGFKEEQGYPPLHYGWKAGTWPHHLVWNDFQAEFFRRAVGPRVSTEVVGPIWFHTCAEMAPVQPKSIAVFDVTPVRTSFYQTLGLGFEYYVPETSVSFLSDIHQAAQEAGYFFLWKRKRHMGRITHPRYRAYAQRLATASNVVVVNPDISAHRLIAEADLVISAPFTSTALIGREMGKPSCYYDPTGRVQKDDRAAHDIPIVSGMNELRDWIRSHRTALSELKGANRG